MFLEFVSTKEGGGGGKGVTGIGGLRQCRQVGVHLRGPRVIKKKIVVDKLRSGSQVGLSLLTGQD